MNKRLVVHYIKNFTCQDKHNQNKKTTQTRTTSIMYTKEKELVILMYKKLRRKRQTTLKKRCRYLFLIYLLIMLLQLSHFRPFTQLHPTHPVPPTFPPYSSCPWIIHISSLASTFPTLFLPSPCLFSTHHLCYLFSVPSPPHSPIDNPPCDLHLYGSVSVLVVCLVFFCFSFRCVC